MSFHIHEVISALLVEILFDNLILLLSIMNCLKTSLWHLANDYVSFLMGSFKIKTLCLPSVLYFNQCLGATHSKPWSNMFFQGFLCKKAEKKKEKQKIWCKIQQKNWLLKPAPECWLWFFSGNKNLNQHCGANLKFLHQICNNPPLLSTNI